MKNLTTDEQIKECESICQDINKTPWQKFKELLYYYCLPNEDININDNVINCPVCTELFLEGDIKDDFDICFLTADNGTAFYEVVTPCCGKVIYTTNNWKSNLHTEADMWEEARQRYREEFLAASKKYDKAKQQYSTLCDLLYERDQGWKK